MAGSGPSALNEYGFIFGHTRATMIQDQGIQLMSEAALDAGCLHVAGAQLLAPAGMLLEDHRRRVVRLLRGERRVNDMERLFSDLRMMKPGRASVREIGHFAAHREERQSGISLDRANDIQTSATLWQKQSDGGGLEIDRLKAAGRANLNIMPDERIKARLGISRQTAEQTFAKALRKFASKKPLKPREADVLAVFGLSMMWQYALDDRTLMSDFADLLVLEGALPEADRDAFNHVSTFVSLYALSILHGARLKMADGAIAHLRLATSVDSGFLRIKADIPISVAPMPISSSVPLFETSLPAKTHCDPQILAAIGDPIPIEIDETRLVALG